MSRDVEHLLRFMHAPGFEYREPRGRAAPVRGPGAAPRRHARGEHTIAVVSPVRGCGRTTIAAQLAWALAREGIRALACDLDPALELRSHFGERAGRGEAPACVAAGADPSAFLDALAVEPDAVVLDTPAGPAAALEQALASADEVLVALRADQVSCDAAPGTEALLARCRARSWRRFRARYVVNQFDARRAGDREAWAALRAMLGGRLWPSPIQWDEAVLAARARHRAVAEVAPASQVAAEVAALARELAGAGDAGRTGAGRAG
jgi:cellulose biosynthesis protein BcsQ